jgi:hypothetical protein
MVELSIDANQMKRLRQQLLGIKDGVPKVLSPAINRALDSGRTAVRREIRKEYVIKQKDIPIRVQGANRANLSGAVIVKQGMLDVSKFVYRPKSPGTKRPLYVQVKKSGGGLISGGFVAAMPTGFTGPFMRTTKAHLPIRKIITIGAAIMASRPSVGPAAHKAMDETLTKRIDYELQRVLARGEG